MSLFNAYGIVIGIVCIVLGVVSIFWPRILAAISHDPVTASELKIKSITLGVCLIAGGLLSMSAVVLGWPPIRGSIIPQ